MSYPEALSLVRYQTRTAAAFPIWTLRQSETSSNHAGLF
ncbi:UNVERIFIED_ORG: hypothetical protein M2328_001716 [Rhodococcus erythropolis]